MVVTASCLCGGYGSGPNEDALMDGATDLPVCDYDENPTPLYKAMERQQWGAVSKFLKTGVWPGDFFSDRITPREQARTWTHRYDNGCHEVRDDIIGAGYAGDNMSTYHSVATGQRSVKGDRSTTGKRYLRWRQLPLHSSLIFMAPPVVVKQLIEVFPYALRCPDDKGMLPLHLAFRQGVPDDILTVLLRLFPNGVHVRDGKGRLPVECVQVDILNSETSAQQPVRGMIIQSIMQQSKEKYSKQQQDTIQAFQKDIGHLMSKMQTLEQELRLMDQREKTTQKELSATAEQLQDLKRSHRKLQEVQRFAIERQSQQEAVEKNTLSFQNRIIDQLDMNLNTPASRDHRRSHSRGRSKSRSRYDSDRESYTPLRSQPPSPPPSLTDQGSQHGYQSSISNHDESPSYSSGTSYKNAFSTAHTGLTGKSRYRTRSFTTHTTRHLDDDAAETDIDDLTAYHSASNKLRGRRPLAKAIYPVKTASDSLLGIHNISNTEKSGSPVAAGAGNTASSPTAVPATKSPLPWNFSFTPGFLSMAS